jgi:hypothetical protein
MTMVMLIMVIWRRWRTPWWRWWCLCKLWCRITTSLDHDRHIHHRHGRDGNHNPFEINIIPPLFLQ